VCIYKENKRGASIEPWGTPQVSGADVEPLEPLGPVLEVQQSAPDEKPR